MAAAKRKREVAWRVFAREFNAATVEFPGEEQYAPTYLLSPLGAMINRVYITGVLTECENIGTDLEPLWRGRVSGPTDVFYISAGQYQPKAAQILSGLEVPALIGIVGKSRTYSPDDLTTYVSVRVELVKKITQELRDYWVLEACQSLNYRLGCMVEALRMEPPETNKLKALGYSKTIADGVIEAINQFGSVEVQQYGQLLINTLKELSLEVDIESPLQQPVLEGEINKELAELHADIVPTSDINQMEGEKSSDDEQKEPDPDVLENLVFEIITSLVDENPEGVDYEEVQAKAAEHGLERPAVEEFISSLIDKGVIYEPSIGVFKAV